MPPPPPSPSRRGVTLSLRAAYLAVTLAVAIPFSALLAYLGLEEIGRERGLVQREAVARAETLATQVEKLLTPRLEAIAGMAAAFGAAGKGEGAGDALARRLRQAFPDLARVTVADEVGAVLVAVPSGGEGRRATVGDQSWFKRAATETAAFVEGPVRVGPEVHVGVYASARSPEGLLRGVIAADLSLRGVQELLGRAGLVQGAVVQLLTERAVVVARQPALFLARDLADAPGYSALVRRQGGVTELVFEDGERRLAGAAPVRPTGWMVVVGLPSAQLLADARARLAWFGAAAATLSLAGLAVALWVSRRQARGMRRLRLAMARLEIGDVPASVPLVVGGEVGALTEGFNHMLAWLHGKVREYEALSRVEEAAGAAMGGEPSVDGMLPGLLRRVVGGMGADAGVLLLHEQGNLVARAAVGLPGVEPGAVKLRRGQGLAGAVVADGSPVAVPDVEADYRVEEPFLRGGGLRSVAAAPIIVGDEVAGVVEVGYRLAHAFAGTEIQRLEAMAKRAGQAMAHVRTLDVVRRNTAGLETRLAEQLEALQQANQAQAEARRQAQEARRQAQELEQRMKVQAAMPPQIKEVIVEKEVVRYDSSGEETARLRVALEKTVSQELRAPLSALMGLPRFLVEGLNKPLGQEEREQLEILRDRGEEILELIDNLVVVSAIEASQVKIAKAPFDLPAVIQRVVRALQPRAAARGNRIDTDVTLGVGQVVSDAKRVEQVLTNLIVNAITYTEVGEIRVSCQPRDGEAVLTVADDGAGFSPDEVARIFEPFLQVGPRAGRACPGTGLRLTVCKRLVDLLGGRIRVESEVDRGTWVTLSLSMYG